MAKTTVKIKLSELGNGRHFVGGKPYCMVGHVAAAFGATELNDTKIPEKLSFLEDEGDGYARVWSTITNYNDRGVIMLRTGRPVEGRQHLDLAVAEFAKHGIIVKLV